MARKKPVKHIVKSYKKSDGTAVRQHIKGSGTTKKERKSTPEYLTKEIGKMWLSEPFSVPGHEDKFVIDENGNVWDFYYGHIGNMIAFQFKDGDLVSYLSKIRMDELPAFRGQKPYFLAKRAEFLSKFKEK